jgi:hypothetical protein
MCVCFNLNAQTESNLQELLGRLEENHMGSLYDVYSQEEIEILKVHFNAKQNPFNNTKRQNDRLISTTQSVSPVTVADIDVDDLSSILEITPSTIPVFEGAGTINRRAQVPNVIIIDDDGKIWERDAFTGLTLQIGSINPPNGETITGMTQLSAADGYPTYGVSTNGNGDSSLLEFNEDWQIITNVPISLFLPIALGKDGADNLYTVDIDVDKLYSINKNTGVTIEIGDIGYDANFGQGMTYDYDSDKLLMIAFNNDIFDAELREFDLSNGMSTSVGPIVPGTLTHFGFGSYLNVNIFDINENTFNDFTIIPNPAQNKININASFDINTIEIYSILGQKIISLTINNTSSEINISELSSGAYIVKITSDGKTSTQKLIKI